MKKVKKVKKRDVYISPGLLPLPLPLLNLNHAHDEHYNLLPSTLTKMGIPNLTRSLNPHSTPILLCKAPDQAPSTTSTTTTSIKCVPSIIIDGPGLIYHIYHRLLSQKPAHLNAIDAQPSCAEVSAGVVRFLGCLLERGVDV